MKNKAVPEAKLVSTKDINALMTPEELEKGLAATLPKWIPQAEDLANSMMAAGQEFLLVVDDVLLRHFKFTEKDIKKFHDELKPILEGVKEFEKHGLNMLSPGDVEIVGDLVQEKGITGLLADIAGVRLQKEQLGRAGLEYPTMVGAGPFIKKLKEKKNG